jgi:hypothetical protein
MKDARRLAGVFVIQARDFHSVDKGAPSGVHAEHNVCLANADRSQLEVHGRLTVAQVLQLFLEGPGQAFYHSPIDEIS